MNIFFSWQSDLPRKNTTSFIEDCIRTAIKELNQQDKKFSFHLDKNTIGEPGHPEIANVILEKIDQARIFVCDLSIVNHQFEGRKTPNPNVVFEFGYAIKSLGWEKIICIINEEYGIPDSLPFDIKHRRLLTYNLNIRDRKTEKQKLVKAILASINILKERGLLYDELEDYFKRDMDTEFLTIVNHIRKIVLPAFDVNLMLDTVRVLSLGKEDIYNALSQRNILGFHLFKNFDWNAASVKRQIDNIISFANYKREKIVVLVKFKEWIDRYNAFTNGRNNTDLFLRNTLSVQYRLLFPSSTELPNRFILGKILDKDKVVVNDFGDILLKDRIATAIYFHQINPIFLEPYATLLAEFINITNQWFQKTGNEFILDNFKNFEMLYGKNEDSGHYRK